MSTVIESLEKRDLKQRPRFGAGDRVRVHFQVVEGNRRRTQVFEGIVIKRQGSGARETFTVRKQSFGVGVERTFPLHSPKIEKLEVAARGDVRRAKLYYLRDKVGKRARVAERRWGIEDDDRRRPRGRGGRRRRGRRGQRGGCRAGRAARGGGRGCGGEGEAGEEKPPRAAEAGWGPGGGGRRAGARGDGRGRLHRRGRRLRVPRPHSTQGALLELVVIVALALGLALGIQAFIIKPYQIPSESMEPTLDVGQRVLVNRFLYHFTDPSIGDIVVFHPPEGANGGGAGGECGDPRTGAGGSSGAACDEPTPQEASVNFIKRIVAGPGDTLSVQNGHPVVNGKIAQEDFIRPCTPGGACNLPKQITIPPDHYFMMGDNRGSSDDSRFWGPVPRDWIIGKAFATYWPPDRIGIF